MKTTTILEATEKAEGEHECILMAEGYLGKKGMRRLVRRSRQADYFRARLLSRVEQGDRAREALRQVEWVPDDVVQEWRYCPWCGNYMHTVAHHAPDCPRQLALGIEP